MFLSIALSFVFVLSFCAAGLAQTSPRKDFPGIKISNFGQMDERFYQQCSGLRRARGNSRP